jgi:hypothetical protein
MKEKWGGSRSKAPFILNLNVSGQHQDPAALPPGKEPRYPLNIRLGGAQIKVRTFQRKEESDSPAVMAEDFSLLQNVQTSSEANPVHYITSKTATTSHFCYEFDAVSVFRLWSTEQRGVTTHTTTISSRLPWRRCQLVSPKRRWPLTRVQCHTPTPTQ